VVMGSRKEEQASDHIIEEENRRPLEFVTSPLQHLPPKPVKHRWTLADGFSPGGKPNGNFVVSEPMMDAQPVPTPTVTVRGGGHCRFPADPRTCFLVEPEIKMKSPGPVSCWWPGLD